MFNAEYIEKKRIIQFHNNHFSTTNMRSYKGVAFLYPSEKKEPDVNDMIGYKPV